VFFVGGTVAVGAFNSDLLGDVSVLARALAQGLDPVFPEFCSS